MQLKEKPLWLFLQRRGVRESLLVFMFHLRKMGHFFLKEMMILSVILYIFVAKCIKNSYV